MLGSLRGIPYPNQAVWTPEEAKEEGIPSRIPSLVFVVRYPPGKPFKAKFSTEAKIGFSLNPMCWSIFAAPVQPVTFNESLPLVPPDEEIDAEFSKLDLSIFTRLDFTQDA